MNAATINIFIAGACTGLSQARDGLVARSDINLVGIASEPSKAGSRLATSSAHVVLYAIERPDAIPSEEIEAIRARTGAPIMLLSSRATPEMLDAAVQLGIEDVQLLPQAAETLAFAVRKVHAVNMVATSAHQRRGSDGCRVITLFSPKGGVGKTAIAANMATTFAQELGLRTLLVDLDLQFGDTAIMLGAQPRSTVLDLVLSHGDLDADKLRGYVTQLPSGLHVLAAPLRPEDADLVTDDRIASMLDAARDAYDVVVIDTAASFSGALLAAIDRTDELLVVASLETTSIKSTKLALQTLDKLQFPQSRRHVVLNRSDSKVGLTRGQMQAALGTPIELGVPSSRSVAEAINRGLPLVTAFPRDEVSRSIARMCSAFGPDAAHELLHAAAPQPRRRRVLTRRTAAAGAAS